MSKNTPYTLLNKYLAKRATLRPLSGNFDRIRHYLRAVVIPALGEMEYLPGTLRSLCVNVPDTVLAETLILVVVNNTPLQNNDKENSVSLHEHIQNNLQTLKWLETESRTTALQLAWIDASSPGNELPAKGGVGLARKIGCDSVLAYLQESANPTPLQKFIFFSLDADTLVPPNYLDAVGRELLASGKSGGTVSFKHQPADTPEAQKAIDTYEIFLNHYVNGLRLAGSPYAVHTIGSCLCFTATGYIRASGFPAGRQAGEDFYFCVELIKTGGIHEINSVTVFPSSRISNRVPFGTGRRMTDATLMREKDLLFYDVRVFTTLRQLLSVVSGNADKEADYIYACIQDPLTRDFLESRFFPRVWTQFLRQYRDDRTRLSAFHSWFDGFVTLKYIHHLTERAWSRQPLESLLKSETVGLLL